MSSDWDDDQAAVWAVVTDLYQAYLDDDRLRLEGHLADGCTMWETASPGLRTKADLVAARQAAFGKPAAPRKSPLRLDATEPVVVVSGDLAYEHHVLDAVFEDSSLDEHLRCTSALRRVDGVWRFVHHHEERLR